MFEIIDMKVLNTSTILDVKPELDVAVVLSRMDEMYAVRIVVILEITCVLDIDETIIEKDVLEVEKEVKEVEPLEVGGVTDSVAALAVKIKVGKSVML